LSQGPVNLGKWLKEKREGKFTDSLFRCVWWWQLDLSSERGDSK
jgi:hypothetical protein